MRLHFTARSPSFILVTPLAALTIACGDDAGSPGGAGDSGSSSVGGANPGGSSNDEGSSDGGAGTGGGMVENDFVAGGDRPVNVRVPDSYDPDTPTPLLILLHYYGAIGTRQDNYFGMSAVADDKDLISPPRMVSRTRTATSSGTPRRPAATSGRFRSTTPRT